MENIEAKLNEGFLILVIRKGKITRFGKATLDFLCPNCDNKNKYEISYNGAIPVLFQKEKKCKNCGTKYIPKIDINLKSYVNFKR